MKSKLPRSGIEPGTADCMSQALTTIQQRPAQTYQYSVYALQHDKTSVNATAVCSVKRDAHNRAWVPHGNHTAQIYK